MAQFNFTFQKHKATPSRLQGRNFDNIFFLQIKTRKNKKENKRAVERKAVDKEGGSIILF